MSGIKKIGYSGIGNDIYTQDDRKQDEYISIPDKLLVVKPDKDIKIIIKEWEGTPLAPNTNIHWILQNALRTKTLKTEIKPLSQGGRINMPKSLCGKTKYYIEASASGKKDVRNVGLWIAGRCESKITSSKWSLKADGEDQRKRFFSWGENVHINLETEGIDGQYVTVEFYRLNSEPTKEKLIKIYKEYKYGIDYDPTADDEQKAIWTDAIVVENGEVNAEYTLNSSWRSCKDPKNESIVNLYYIKVRNKKNVYITDGKDTIHARFLRVQNKIVKTLNPIKVPKNNTAAKVGEPAENFLDYTPCKYTSISYKGKKVFDEQEARKGKKIEKTIHLHLLAGGSDKNKEIKIELGNNKKPKCSNHKTKVFNVEILKKAGFQDSKKISEDAFSFKDNFRYDHKDDYIAFLKEYFLPLPAIEANLPITTCAYQHILDIKIYPDVAWAYHFAYDSPPKKYFKDININLQKGLDNELQFLLPYTKDVFKFSFIQLPESITNYMAEEAIDYLKKLSNKFAFGIHAYHTFDSNAKNPAVIMDYTAKYPWIAKALIIYCVVVSLLIEALILYLTRGKGSATKVGKVLSTADKAKQATTNYLKGKNIEFISPKICTQRAQYFEGQANGSFSYIQLEKVEALPLFGIQYENKHTLGSLVCDTVGISKVFDYARKAVSIMGKITLAKKISKKIGEIFDDVRDPTNTSTGKESTEPLRWGDATTVLNNTEEKIQNTIDAYAEKFGQKLEFVLTIKGEYQAFYEVTINHAKKNIILKETKDGYSLSGSKVAFGRRKGIDAVASCELKAGYHINTLWIMDYTPDFIDEAVPKVDSQGSIEGKAEIHGSLFYERIYTIEANGNEPYYVDNVIFSGIAGSFSGSALKKVGNRVEKKQVQETPFVLVDPYVVKGKKIPLFSKESFKEHI